MGKIQPTKFSSVGEFLDFLPEEELDILGPLRALIFECIPECEEKLAYNVPFYYRNTRICFLWPASIPWGGVKQGVRLGFSKGYLLKDEIGYLEKGSRKQVFTKTFIHEQEVERDRDLIKAYLFEARAFDKE